MSGGPGEDSPAWIEREDLFAEMANGLPLIVWVHDAEGQQVMVNDTFCEFFGVTREEMKGGRWQLLTHPEDTEAYTREFLECTRERRPFHHEVRVRLANDEWRWLESWARPRFSRTGEFRGMVGTSVDITKDKADTEALRRAHALIEGITEGTQDNIAAVDTDYRFTYYNASYRREYLKLWNVDIRPGMNLLDGMASWPEEQRKAKDLWRRALDGETFSIETEFGPAPGEKRVYDLRFNPIHDTRGRIVGASHIISDVTESIELREALRLNEDRLREAGQRKDEYLAMLGHELRNPLAAIQNATELIGLLGMDEPRLERITGVLSRQTRPMARLIDGLLEVSRIARGKIELDTRMLDLRNVCGDVLRDRAAMVNKYGLELVEDFDTGPLWVEADPVRLTQVIDNLIGNALKFTPIPGRIDLGLRQDGDWAVLRIRDTGVGIRPEQLTLIFEPFHQGKQEIDRGGGGLGLGLPLSKGLIELHGGSIEARSDGPGLGSEFIVSLPLAGGAGELEVSPAPVQVEAHKVLIVEDNADAAQMLSEVLQQLGHEAMVAETATAGLELLRTQRPNIVLCDIGLPGMSGHEFALAIRSDPVYRDLALVALTGYGQPEDRQRTAEAGFDAHLTKPVSIADLSEIFDRLIG